MVKFSFKSFFALVTAIFLTFSLVAQEQYLKSMLDENVNFYEVCAQAEAYFNTIDRNKKGSGWKGFMRWKVANEGKYYPSGNRKHVNHALHLKAFESFSHTAMDRGGNAPWTCLGPYKVDSITFGYNSGIGRVECFEVDPGNDNIIYLGSKSGGFWKTSDSGKTWKNTTDFLPTTGVFAMDVNPFNRQEILINSTESSSSLSFGIYRSTDAGETWNHTILHPSLGFGGPDAFVFVRSIAYHPLIKDLVFLGTTEGLYRSEDNLQTFQLLYPGKGVIDIEFHPTNPDVMYFISLAPPFENTVAISKNRGITFSPSNILIDNNGYPGTLDVTPARPDNVYYASRESIYKSIDKGSDFQLIGKLSSNSASDLSVSDIDTVHFISGYVNLEASYNGGQSFTPISDWNSIDPDSSYVHADLVMANCQNGVFYVATDGYLCRSRNFGKSWERLNDGTCIREFYRIGISQSDVDVQLGGSQDMGTSILNKRVD
jgi:photosystem II stability/assembly factor-like uncharacterized protein